MHENLQTLLANIHLKYECVGYQHNKKTFRYLEFEKNITKLFSFLGAVASKKHQYVIKKLILS